MSYHSGNNLVDPYELFQKAQLQPGMHVADFGCGRTGHIVFPASRVIGEKGMVYALDVLKPVLEHVHKRAALDAVHNVHTIWTDLERVGHTAIPANTIDVVFIVNTLVQTTQRTAVLDEADRLLKEKGRVVVVDWKKKGLPFGPQDAHFVAFDEIVDWARGHGFAIQEDFAMGPYHRGLVLFRA